MKKAIILITILLLSCVTTTRNPFDDSNTIDSPRLIIKNNHWDVRVVRVFCDDSQIQIIRGVMFNVTQRKRIPFCSTNYRFTVNDQWRSNFLNWDGGDINLVIEANISLSYVY